MRNPHLYSSVLAGPAVGLRRMRTSKTIRMRRIHMLTKRELLRSLALAAITATTAKSGLVLAQTSADRPGFFAAKDIG